MAQLLDSNITGNLIVSSNISLSGNSTVLTIGTNGALVINVSTNSPNFTTANQAAFYTKNVANIVLFGVETQRANNANFDPHQYFASHQAFKMIGTVRPQLGTTNTTCFIASGLTMNLVAATSYSNTANGVPTNTAPIFKNSNKRFQISAANSATTGNATFYANVNTAWGGSTSNGGGYIYSVRFAYDTVASNLRSFIGVTSATSTMAPTSTDYEPRTNQVYSVFGVGANVSSAGNLWLIYGIAGSARTATDLGNQFVINTNDVFELFLAVPPGGSSAGYRVRNLTNGAETQGVITTNLPLSNTWMQPVVLLKSNTAANSNLSIMNMYLETDY